MKRFPLPDDWQDVWEGGTARYYFWNTKTDQVSWLPPLHPDAKITVSAEKMRLLTERTIDSDENSDSDDSMESDEDSSDDGNKKLIAAKSSSRIVAIRSKKDDTRQKRHILDPMDPAAYSSSCPRGKWSDGLDASRERAKDSE